MKSKFIGHFKPSKDDFDGMWRQNTFVFDTNVLLNLYRYSEETRNRLLELTSSFKDRVWLPRKVADEFFDNRLDVLGKQAEEYDALFKDLEKIDQALRNTRQHPFVSTSMLENIANLFKTLKSELEDNKDSLLIRLSNDEILQRLGDLFDGKIDSGFTPQELESIYLEGAKRVEKKIPPGFKDAKAKVNCLDDYRIYGDLILWKEILKKSATDRKGIIFVTDDKKEDWWLEAQGRRIGPLPGLIQEFFEETKQSFYMYTVDRFMEYASKFLNTEVTMKMIEEVRDVSDTIMKEAILKLGYICQRQQYTIITEQELIDKLSEYEKLISSDPYAYVGLKNFVVSVLGAQGYEINHSYAIINNLITTGVIKLYETETAFGIAKAITLNECLREVLGKNNV